MSFNTSLDKDSANAFGFLTILVNDPKACSNDLFTSLKSFSNGGFFGQGIGNGEVSKNLPDAHSDFIYALIGEEFGFITALLVLLLYFVIYFRIFMISKITNNFFILNSLVGLGNILIFQTIINVSSSLNLMPTKGMTLPFISYGGSSIISSSIIIGFILTLINYAKKE